MLYRELKSNCLEWPGRSTSYTRVLAQCYKENAPLIQDSETGEEFDSRDVRFLISQVGKSGTGVKRMMLQVTLLLMGQGF